MAHQTMALFTTNVSYYQQLFDQISKDYPDLKPMMEDLIFPIKLLSRLASDAEGVLNNDPNSIEKSRYLLIPEATGNSEIQEAIKELLPDDKEKTPLDNPETLANESLIHYGEFVVTALAAGRVGMREFNLVPSSNEYIDIVKYNACAALPIQALSRVLRTGFDIGNFAMSLRHQAKNGNAFLFLKTLARTFWDKRELMSASILEQLSTEVKSFYAACDTTEGWDGTENLKILDANFLNSPDCDELPLEILTNLDRGKCGKINAYFVWESLNLGQQLGFVTRKENIGNKQYRRQKSNFYISTYDHPAGWVGLQTDSAEKNHQAFAAGMVDFWDKKNTAVKILNSAAVPVERLPGRSGKYPLIPIIPREKFNLWGAEFKFQEFTSYEKSGPEGEKEFRGEIKCKFWSPSPPRFTLETYNRDDNIEIIFDVLDLDNDKGTVNIDFALEQLSTDDKIVLLSLYLDPRPSAHDIEAVDISSWQDIIQTDPSQDNTDNDQGTGDDTGDDTGGNTGGNTDSNDDHNDNTDSSFPDTDSLPVVLVRPGVLLLNATADSDDNAATVMQVSYDEARSAVANLEKQSQVTMDEIILPFQADDEVTFVTEASGLTEKQREKFLDGLIEMSENTEQIPRAIWISLVQSEVPFCKIALSTNSNGLVVSTPDKLPEAFRLLHQQRLRVNPYNALEPEDAISFRAGIFNGSITLEPFVRRDKRILKNDGGSLPSQWIAYGFTKNQRLLFEQRINLPSEIFSGTTTISLPYYDQLEKIDLRFQPELFAIEVASVNQPGIAEASVRLMSNSSVLRGSAFRPVSPTPSKRLLSLQKISGSIAVQVNYNRASNSLHWTQGHSAGLATHVRLYVENSRVARRLAKPLDSQRSYSLNGLVVKTREAEHLNKINLEVSDGWNSQESAVDKTTEDFPVDQREILPRNIGNLYWADVDDNLSGSGTMVNWLVDNENAFGSALDIKNAVRLPDDIPKSDIHVRREFTIG